MVKTCTALGLALVLALVGGWSAPASAAFSSDARPSWVPNGTVRAMVRAGAVVYLGGDFTSLRDPASGAQVARAHIAAVDAVTGAPVTSWNPGVNGSVEAIAVGPDGTVYAGGEFTAAAGRTATRLAAFTSAGSRVPGWSAAASGEVFDLYTDGGSLFVGGRFGSVNGASRPKLAKLDAASGALVPTFNAHVAGGRVVSLAPSADGQSLLVGGAFDVLDGTPRSFAGAVSLTTGHVDDWAPRPECDTCYLWDLTTSEGVVYAAVGGPGGRVVAWDAVSGARRWARRGDGNVQAVDVFDGVVYVGGHFGPDFSGATRHQLAAVSAATGALLPYSVEFAGRDHPGIWAVDADSDGLRIAGGFVLANDPARKYAVLPSS